MKGATLLKDFRAFAFKDNLIDVAVAFVLGVAFAAVVKSLVDDVILSLVAAIVGKSSFDDLTLHIGDGVVKYGSFLTALLTFLIVATVLFVFVKAVDRVRTREATMRDCPHCLSTIPLAAGACRACGRDVP